MKKLTLASDKLSTAKSLIESRRFNVVEINGPITEDLEEFYIDTEQLEIHETTLKEILKHTSIKLNSLFISIHGRKLDNDLSRIKIRFVYLFLYSF